MEYILYGVVLLTAFVCLARKFDTQNPRKPYLAYFFAQI